MIERRSITGILACAAAVAVMVFFSAPASGRSAQYAMCEMGPIRSVTLSGCDPEVAECTESGFIAQVISLGDLRVGGYLDSSRIPVALDRIRALGFFSSVDLDCVYDGEGVDVTLEVRPTVRVRSIRFKGNKHFWDSSLLEKMSVRNGDPFDINDKHNWDQLASARNVIKKEYQKDGFTGTEVTVDAIRADKYGVDIVVTVKEGKRIRIKEIFVYMHPAGDVDVGSIETPQGVESCPVIRHQDLIAWSGYKRGSPLTEKTPGEITRNLTQKLRSAGFAGVKVTPTFNQLSGVMSVDVAWDSCWLLRFYGRAESEPGVDGYKILENVELVETLSFDDAGIFDISEASRGRSEIKKWYEDRGYLFADVALDYRSRSGPAPTSVSFRKGSVVDVSEFGPGVAGRISYFITTGRKAEIRDIRIIGNDSISKEDILAVMATRPYDFFGSPGAVLPDQILLDLEKIRNLYRDRGFPSMRFPGASPGYPAVTREKIDETRQVITYSNETGAFKVEVSLATEGVYLEIVIDEGQHVRTGVIMVQGNSFLSTAEIVSMMDMTQGSDFSPAILQRALRKVARRYVREGFLKAEVDISCEGFEPVVGRSECNPDTVRSDTVDLYLEISEGQRTMVGEVFIEGALKTKRSVILKDLPRPGQPYDVEKVASATRYLNNLGIFESVRVEALGVSEKPPRDRVALVVRVREAKSKFLDFALGLEKLDSTRSADMPAVASSIITNTVAVNDIAGTGFGRSLGLNLPDILVTFEMRYSDTNFLGRAKRLYLPVKYGLSFTAWDRYASFTPTYLDPNFFARGLMFRVTPYAEYDRATKALDRVQFGAEFALSKELYPHLFGAISFDTGVIRSRDPQQTSEYGPWRYENKLIPTLTYDGLDHPINPTRGFFAQAAMSYINDVSEGNYLKYEFVGKAFFSVKKLITFGLTGRVGGSKSFSASGDLPLEERYTLGGNRGLRGFSTDGVGQYNADKSLKLRTAKEQLTDENGNPVVDTEGNPVMKTTWLKPFGGDVVVSGSFEIRFPIFRKIDLYGAAFYDFGALAEEFTDLSGASFRHSVGVGIRYMLAGTVPIRLDYGIILDRRCKIADPDTGQCEKKDEVGNIHFGILYTF